MIQVLIQKDLREAMTLIPHNRNAYKAPKPANEAENSSCPVSALIRTWTTWLFVLRKSLQ
jgi:hypothetical protein